MQWNGNKWSYALVLVFTLCTTILHAQLEASNWYFGENAGVRFDPVTGAVTALTNGQLSTREGCASISDQNGNLLFYTDGSTVFDSSHSVMQNGTGLRGNPSSTQSAIIIPKPQDPNIYYIFTVNTLFQGGGTREINYYEVDMTFNSGLGAVTTNISNPNTISQFASEKLTAINRANSDEILVTFLEGNGTNFTNYVTYTVSATGVSATGVNSPPFTSVGDPRGNLKISPDGTRMVSCNAADGTFLFDYDATTGLVSNERRLALGNNNISYGVEFSPDSRLIYITATNNVGATSPPANHSSTLYQFEVNATAIGGFIQGQEIDTRQGYRGSLQLGIDGRIYRSLSENFNIGSSFLGVIENPNVFGVGCNYQHDAIALAGRLSTQGLPPFIQSFFALLEIENTCLGDMTTFSFQSDTPPLSILWDFGDGTTSTLENPSHVYATTGTYTVSLTLDINGAPITYTQDVEIFDLPVANPVGDVDICDIGNDGLENVNLSSLVTPIVLGSQDPTSFIVRYFLNQQDADDNLNQIVDPYALANTQETLFVRINNANNANCFDTTSFDLNLFEQPSSFNIDNVDICDTDADGIIATDLTSNDAVVLGTQDPTIFDVSYHISQTDADFGINPLFSPYTNTTPFNEVIFVRVFNRNNNDCFDTSQSFTLNVNPLPEAINASAFQCDEDGNPDGRTVFNLSEFDATISNNASDVTVSYHINQNDADNNISPLNNTDYTNNNASQIVIARVTNDLTGCFNTSQITLEVSASDAQDTQLETCDDDGTIDGLTEFVLSNADSSVLSSAPPNVTVNYYETLNDALTELNVLPNQYTNSIPSGQTIYARAESPDGNCFGISEVVLTVNELPVVEPVDLLDYCGNNPQPLTIDAGALIGNTSDYTFSWDTGETTYAIEVTTGGNYAVNVINANGCSSTRVVTVIISDQATINSIDVIHAGANATGTATINASGLGEYEYRISLDEEFQDSPVFENLKPGLYTAYVRDINGCGTVRQNFVIIGYPRFFTPNNDGFNDFWQLTGTSFDFEPNARIFIFDRYGKLLKQIAADGPGWDGTYNNQPMPSSDYWFKAILSDGFTFSSHFTLKR